MNWTLMRFGMPNSAVIVALALLPIIVAVFHPTMISDTTIRQVESELEELLSQKMAATTETESVVLQLQ